MNEGFEESIQREDFEINFDLACKYVKNNAQEKLNEEQILKLYGLYKLAKFGKCDTECPSFLFYKRQKMWSAWNSMSQKDIKNPMKMYVDYLSEQVPEWKLE